LAKTLAKEATKADKELRKSKKRRDKDVTNEVEQNIFASTYKINRGAYNGGTFNGVHCRLLMTDAEPIFEYIKAYLLSVDYETKLATDAQIIENCDTMKHLLVEQDDIAFSILRMPFGTPEEEHYTLLEEALVEVKRLWNVLGLSHTPKLHALTSHALDQMNGFGDMLEDHVKKSHHDVDKFHQRVATLRSFEKRAKSYSHHEKIANNAEVLAAKKHAIDTTSRKRKADGPGLAIGRSSEKKVARNMTHSDNHAAQQMRPAGEKIQPHERSKLDWTIRITVLKINTVNACSSCSWSVDRVQQATVATEQTLFITTKSNEDDKEISTGSKSGCSPIRNVGRIHAPKQL
jgi:hypothetical protein